MTNHYHLLLEMLDGKLSKGMRQLNGLYTQRVNPDQRVEFYGPVHCFIVADGVRGVRGLTR